MQTHFSLIVVSDKGQTLCQTNTAIYAFCTLKTAYYIVATCQTPCVVE
jgi:hypothetical protein